MTLIKHPTLSATREVPEERLDAWLRGGWLLADDEAPDDLDEVDSPHDSTAAAIATDQGQHSDEGDEA